MEWNRDFTYSCSMDNSLWANVAITTSSHLSIHGDAKGKHLFILFSWWVIWNYLTRFRDNSTSDADFWKKKLYVAHGGQFVKDHLGQAARGWRLWYTNPNISKRKHNCIMLKHFLADIHQNTKVRWQAIICINCSPPHVFISIWVQISQLYFYHYSTFHILMGVLPKDLPCGKILFSNFCVALNPIW